MDEPMKKSGTWPNVAVPAGSDAAAVMAAHGVGSRQDDGRDVDTRERLSAVLDMLMKKELMQSKIDELTAERDRLREAIDAMGNGQFYALYRKACAERDRLRDEIGSEPFCETVKRWLDGDAPDECRDCDEGCWAALHAKLAEECDTCEPANAMQDEIERLRMVVKIQADSFKALEREIADLKADNAKHGQ